MCGVAPKLTPTINTARQGQARLEKFARSKYSRRGGCACLRSFTISCRPYRAETRTKGFDRISTV